MSMAGGLLSAVIGPQLNKLVQDAYVIPFVGTYLAIAVLNIVGMFLFFALDLPGKVAKAAQGTAARVRSIPELLRTPRIIVAVICAMVAYSLMNPGDDLDAAGRGRMRIHQKQCQRHRVGPCAGDVCTQFRDRAPDHPLWRAEDSLRWVWSASQLPGWVALQGITLGNFFVALILLGVGWNFGFIGGTSMLAGCA